MATCMISSSKLNSTTIPLVCDFISSLQGDDAVVAVDVTVSVFSGVDASPSAILSGAATIAQNRVTQVITGGTVGVVYRINFSVTTFYGNNVIIYTNLAVINSTPFTAL